jgi:nitroimidazol reductase NimA-like FMN-containing flavoprotein (pyridoxamine 5'-phosphate oxidase superfamily)
MRGIRRKEKEIESEDQMLSIIERAKYVTMAMCNDNEPYLVTISHGLDRQNRCIYFHCAQEGKKIEILQKNSLIWGQAIDDLGYVEGACDHLYATTHFRGRVSFIQDLKEKEYALKLMIQSLEPNPEKVIQEQITESSLHRVNIGRIDIEYMSGKTSKEIIISL